MQSLIKVNHKRNSKKYGMKKFKEILMQTKTVVIQNLRPTKFEKCKALTSAGSLLPPSSLATFVGQGQFFIEFQTTKAKQ